MALADVVRAVFQYRVQDQVCCWGLYYEAASGSDDLTDCSNLLTGLVGQLGSPILDCLATDATAEGWYAYGVVPGSKMPARLNAASSPGTDSGTAAPANLCAVFTLQTAAPTAKKHGRIYFSGISKSRLTSGLWSSSFLSGPLGALSVALGETFTEAGTEFRPVTLQKVLNGSPITPVVHPLAAVRVTQVPYGQKRRSTKQFGSGA